MSKNPNRKSENQVHHDNILKALANDMSNRGYNVKADHIEWSNGAPNNYYGHIPDVIATSLGNGNFIMEVEDCTTYKDEHTKEQLESFIKVKGFSCYIILPKTCYRQEKPYDTVEEMKTILKNWGLQNVNIGYYDWNTKTITYL